MGKTTRYARILDALKEMELPELVQIHNAYCDANNMSDDIIYSMDDFDNLLKDMSPSDLVRMFIGDRFNSNDDYWYFDGYGHLHSWSAGEMCIDYTDIACYADTENDALGNDTLAEILEEEEEDIT